MASSAKTNGSKVMRVPTVEDGPPPKPRSTGERPVTWSGLHPMIPKQYIPPWQQDMVNGPRIVQNAKQADHAGWEGHHALFLEKRERIHHEDRQSLSFYNTGLPPGTETKAVTMSEAGKTVSSQARTKKLMLNAQLKTLHDGNVDADRLLAIAVPDDEEQCKAEYSDICEFASLFAETISRTETLFEEFGEMVFEFVATKTNKELKKKEEENLDVIVDIITESNGKLAKLKGKQAKLTSKPSTNNAAITGPNTTNVQIDTSGLVRVAFAG